MAYIKVKVRGDLKAGDFDLIRDAIDEAFSNDDRDDFEVFLEEENFDDEEDDDDPSSVFGDGTEGLEDDLDDED
jgi:hypothetical protein